MMQVRVPMNAVPGSQVEVNLPNGKKARIQIPVGARPGSTIQFPVPPGGSDIDNDSFFDDEPEPEPEPMGGEETATLYTRPMGDSSEAMAEFGQRPGMLVGLPTRGWAPYLIVPEGFYALITSGGAEIPTSTGSHVWPAGFVGAGPLTRISHLVTKAFCVFDVPVKGCKTADNVTVTIDCSIVFRIMGDAARGEDPELVRTFVHNCTPNGLEQQLKDAMAEEIRTLARSMKHTDVYTARLEQEPEQAKAAEEAESINEKIIADAKRKADKQVKKQAAAAAAVAQPAPQMMKIQVPENATPGMQVEIALPNGKKARIAIPEGAKPGAIIQFPVPGQPAAAAAAAHIDDEDDNDDDGLEMTDMVPEAEAREQNSEEREARVGVDVTLEMRRRLNEQFEPQGVHIQDIMIQNIRLPRNIEKGMSNKTLVRSKQEFEVMEQTFGMQTIRLKNEEDKSILDFQEAEAMARVEGDRDVQASRDALAERQAERDKVIDEYKQGTLTEESKIKAEMKELVTKLKYEYETVMQTLKLEALEKAAEIKADSEAKVAELRAETKFQIAELEGEAKKVLAKAEEDSNEFLQTKRDLEIREQKLDIYESFCKNTDVVLSTTDSKEFNMLMLADNVLESSQTSGGANSREALEAELNKLRLASNAYGLRGDTYIPAASE